MEAHQPTTLSKRQRLLAALFAPVDISFLIYLRVMFGGIMTCEVGRYFFNGWIRRYYIDPAMHFTYYGFEWVKPWPGEWMYVHFAVLGLCGVCVLLGFCYRMAAALFFLGFTYVFLLDEVQYLNHFYLISLISLLLVFVPAERALSVDAWLRPQLRSMVAPGWTLWLLRFQIGVPYFFGGIAKIGADWLRGEPMRMWLAERVEMPVIGPFVHEEWMVYFFVIGGLLLDLLIVPALLWKRTRLYALGGAVAFHGLNANLFHIGIFPWFMLATTLVFFPPDTLRKLISGKGSLPMQPWHSGAMASREKWIVSLLALYVAIQLLMPLRHLLCSGNVNWTEQGHRFSWHMKYRTKEGDVMFAVIDPDSNQSWTVDARRILTPRQYAKMATHPDMILQMSHFIAEQERQKGNADVEVHGRALVSLNGRQPQLLVDPHVNLAQKERSLFSAPWILPLREPFAKSGMEWRPNRTRTED